MICDHGLRQESADEAKRVAKRFREMGMQVEILTLNMKYGPAIQERARTERYDVMLQTMREHGYNALLLGHHLYDQAETIAFRAMRNSGADGLAGMAVVREMQDSILVRPFLTIEPERLRVTLNERGVEWEEDPTNATGKYTRNKLRMLLNDNPSARQEILQAGQVFASRRVLEEAKATKRLQDANMKLTSDWATLDLNLLGQDETAVRAMTYLVNRIGVNSSPLAKNSVRLLLKNQKGTLGGAMLRKREGHDETWYLAREEAYIEPSVKVKPWATWDNRYRVGNCEIQEMSLGAVGANSWIKILGKQVPMWVLKTVPCFRAGRNGNQIVALPTLNWYLDDWKTRVPALKPYGTIG
jgi:tRNA(Ile)-lysidine synthase